MINSNLVVVDRVLRFALAFWWLGPWAPTFAADWANILVMAIGWIALIESFIGWCWLHTLFGIRNKNQ